MKGFDNEAYIKLQSAAIKKRIKMFGGKLYLEFGGKLLDDLHAARVLPGFNPSSKVKMLRELKDQVEIIFCISASHIEKKKMRADYGISYETELLRLVDNLQVLGLPTVAVVITQYTGQETAIKFKHQLERRGLKAYFHTLTKGYPTDVDTIVSEEGYGVQPYIKTTKPLVVVAAPGPKSGKLATCLAQLYHEYRRGVKAGYAKFETFPVWDLPLKHPVNLAYEASTADLNDFNMIDSFHLEKYGKSATNYNRDMAVFPILKNILYKIAGKDLYYSPTDMGVNMITACITDDDVIKKASRAEIIRRYLNGLCDYKNGLYNADVPDRLKVLMDEAGVSVSDRKVVAAAHKARCTKQSEIVAIELPDGAIITGKDTGTMTAPATAVLNAIKTLGKIDDAVHLILPITLDPMLKLKKDIYGEPKLGLNDVLIALAIGEATNPTVALAMSNLSKLQSLEAHSTVILSKTELCSLKKLGLNVTCTDEFAH